MNDVLTIPAQTALEIPSAGLEYAVSILTAEGFLNTDATYVNEVLEIPNVTFFTPNSAQGLADAQALGKNSSASQVEQNFNYHIVSGIVAYSPMLKNGMTLKTLQGEDVTITLQ
jgi:uncharacterized surface protein with fasciclin (FAS1) repeats